MSRIRRTNAPVSKSPDALRGASVQAALDAYAVEVTTHRPTGEESCPPTLRSYGGVS